MEAAEKMARAYVRTSAALILGGAAIRDALTEESRARKALEKLLQGGR